MPSVNYNINHKQEVITTNTKDRLGVTALVAIMEPATESQSGRAYKQPLRSRPRSESNSLNTPIPRSTFYNPMLWNVRKMT
eukprot:CCRYP_006033-RA/>CCRYP_006033-RA protein AED:0.31 eAED:0.34 QI:0/0/0.5/1/0/0/2/2799/80